MKDQRVPTELSAMPTGDRRPIASRELRVWKMCAGKLARAGVSANAISVAGMLAGLAGGGLLVATGYVDGWAARGVFLVAAGAILLRLLANMLDGMVAIASGKASVVGELFNELPDRISDTAILAGAGYAAGGDPVLGWAAACVALLVTYVRALGKTVGVPGLFGGPMSKSHRMFLLTVACVYAGCAPGAWRFSWSAPGMGRPVGVIGTALLIVIAGGLVTAVRRLLRLVRTLKEGR